MKSKYQRIFRLMLEENKILSFIWLFLSMTLGVLPASSVIINKKMVNQLEEFRMNDESENYIIFWLILTFLIAVIIEIIKNLVNYIYVKIKYNISFKLERYFYGNILKYSMEEFEDSNLYNNVLMAGRALEMNSLDIIVLFINSISSGITLVTIMITLITINWKLPLILIAASIPSGIGIIIMKKYKYKIRESLLELTRKTGYYTSLFTDKKGIRDIKLFELKDFFMNIWVQYTRKIIKKAKQVAFNEGLVNVCGQVVINLSIFAATVSLVNMVIDGSIDLGSFVSLLTAVTLFQSTLTTISENSASIYEMNLYIEALFKFMDREEVEDLQMSGLSLEKTTIESIQLRDVYFKYKQANSMTVQDINVSINKGDKVAIVGYNGAGKTTLINLLLGLYSPNKGDVLINGKALSEYDVNTYYSKISCISQDFIKYDFTLFQNIALNRPDTEDNRKRVVSILKRLEFDDKKVNRLDDTLSAKYAGGFELSGGEWQKVAIARAGIRDAEIVIFDEPTAALDPIAELEVYNDLNKLSKDKTSIVISHRLGIARFCNKIIVMKDGRIVETGSHDELLEKAGEYAYLYSAQAGWYNT